MKELVLELRNGNKVVRSWNLERNKQYVLGRSSDVDIVIEEKSASRRHAQITVMPGGSATIQDLSSANGTFVDGKPASQNQMILLRKGTQIVLAEMRSMLVINERNVESEDEDDEEQRPKLGTKHKEDEEEKKKTLKQKERRSRSNSPKNRSKKENNSESRSRSRSQEKENDRIKKPENNKPQLTIKYPKKFIEEQKLKEKAGAEAAVNDNTKSNKSLQQLGLEEDEAFKFMKLMGLKNVKPQNIDSEEAKALPGLKYLKKDIKEFNNKTTKMNQDLEDQYFRGMMRRGIGKQGLGFQ